MGFIGATVGYYTSAKFMLPSNGDIQRDANNAYIAPDGKGFSIGGWVCQVKNHVVVGDGYEGTLKSLCAQEMAARWMTLPLFMCYTFLLVAVVLRFTGEKKRMRRSHSTFVKKDGNLSESD